MNPIARGTRWVQGVAVITPNEFEPRPFQPFSDLFVRVRSLDVAFGEMLATSPEVHVNLDESGP